MSVDYTGVGSNLKPDRIFDQAGTGNDIDRAGVGNLQRRKQQPPGTKSHTVTDRRNTGALRILDDTQAAAPRYALRAKVKHFPGRPNFLGGFVDIIYGGAAPPGRVAFHRLQGAWS